MPNWAHLPILTLPFEINVVRATTAVPIMGGGNLQDQTAKRCLRQPPRHCVAQHPAAGGDHMRIVRAALAGDYQNQPVAARSCIQDEAAQRPMGPIRSHPVQVDPRFGPQFAAFQAAMGFGVHA